MLATAAEALRTDDPARRLRAVGLLGDLEGREAVVLLASVLTDADTEVRARSALTLASRQRDSTSDTHLFSDDHLRDVLVQMVIDGRKDVEAGEALAGLAREEAQIAGREPSEDQARTADRTAGADRAGEGADRAGEAVAASATVVALLDRLRDPATPAVGRVRLVQALGEQPDAVVRVVVAPFLDDDDADVARIATYLAHRAAEQPRP